MTVAELRLQLEEIMAEHADDIVVMSIDEEGNGYRALQEIATENVFLRYDGEIRLRPEALTDDMRKQGYTEEDTYLGDRDPDGRYVGDAEACVVLWPY